jgi:nitric oxide reductase NorD protein
MPLFEPEETVGKYWHRLVGGAHSYPHHTEAAVTLESVRGRLGVMFRALGGSGAVRIAAAAAMESGHRLNVWHRIGLGREKIERAVLDASTLRLPSVIDVFPRRDDNEALYEWLAAWFANADGAPPRGMDALQDDVLRLRSAAVVTRATLARWPGLTSLYARLQSATLAARPARSLPRWEAEIEACIAVLLGGTPRRRPRDELLAGILDDGDIAALRAPPAYQAFLPVPVWGDVVDQLGMAQADDTDDPAAASITVDTLRRRAMRRSSDQSQRDDPLMLHRFETIFSVAEMVNVNRTVEDDDAASARQAADDLPELTISAHSKRAATRLKLDLDLAAPDAAAGAAFTETSYAEWDWKRKAYHRNYCRVVATLAPETGEDWRPDEAMQRRIRQVRRQFEALRPRRQVVRGEPDGDDLDLSALVRSVADRHAGGVGSERVFVAARSITRDLSVAVLMDVSLSTDAWLQEHRVLDVEKSALLAFSHGLSACGDEHAIFAFTSRRRSLISVKTVKGFDEPLGAKVIRRIQALKPGQYTRIGAAVRHVAGLLEHRPHRTRLLLVLTDGKPNDVDHYEGRYGVEDTRMAIREARKLGIRVFGVTVDEQAREYFPYIFGRGGYAIFPHIARLPVALPAIYRQITG